MSRNTVVRILEAFFKKWFLYVLPLVAMVLLGLANFAGAQDEFTSNGSVFVNSGNLVTSLSEVPDGGVGSFLTPAQFASQELNGLLQTDVFIASVLATAGVDASTTRVFWTDQIAEARAAIGSVPTSENLVQVAATTPDPILSERLTTATIEEFIDFKIELDVAESEASEEFYAELAAGYQEDARASAQAVTDFLADVTSVTALPPTRQEELTRLRLAATLAQSTYVEAVGNVEASSLASRKAETEVRQGFSVVDPAQVPTTSNSGLIDQILGLITYGIIGVVLMVLGPVIAAMTNRSVLFPADLAHLGDARVVATVPRASRGEMKLTRASAPDQTSGWVPSPRLSPPTDQSWGMEADAAPPSPAPREMSGEFGDALTAALDRLIPSTIQIHPDARVGGHESATDPQADYPPPVESDPRRAHG